MEALRNAYLDGQSVDIVTADGTKYPARIRGFQDTSSRPSSGGPEELRGPKLQGFTLEASSISKPIRPVVGDRYGEHARRLTQ